MSGITVVVEQKSIPGHRISKDFFGRMCRIDGFASGSVS